MPENARCALKPAFCLAILLFATSCVIAQEKLDVSVSIVTYQQADSADVIKQDRGVIVIAEGVQPGIKYAAKLRVVNQDHDYIEVFPQRNPFPPAVVEAFRPGEYLIPGNPGDSFNVSIRSSKSKPFWLLVLIPEKGDSENGDKNPVKPSPSPDFAAIEQVSFDQAVLTKDLATAKSLAASLKAIDFTKAKDLADAVLVVQTVRAKVFVNRPDMSKDWSRYLAEIDAALSSCGVKSTGDYQKAIACIIRGLEKAAASLSQGSENLNR